MENGAIPARILTCKRQQLSPADCAEKELVKGNRGAHVVIEGAKDQARG